MKESKIELRKSKEQIKKEFEEYKKTKKDDAQTLQKFLSHCNVIPEIIERYLDILKKEDINSFIDNLLFYYPILTVEVCKKYDVLKKISEKERFFKLAKEFSSIETDDLENNLRNFIEREIKCYEEVERLIIEEAKIKKENENKQTMQPEKEKYCRWFNRYNTPIDYKSEENEEYLFYTISNSLIKEFLKNHKCFKTRIKLINYIIDLFEVVMSKREKNNIFCKHFEYLCLAMTNSEIINETDDYIMKILSSIENETTISKIMNLGEIENFLTKKNIKYKIENKNIIIDDGKMIKSIDDYEQYNFDENTMISLLNSSKLMCRIILEQSKKFSEYVNKGKYVDELLIKSINNYSQSKLAISSIEKLFKIDKKEYEKFFKVISEDIENYIYIIPYNCIYDTERTCKNPIKVMIDPLKEKYFFNKNYINDLDLESALRDFSNVVFRKFAFEHEIHNLSTVLLNFLYVDKDAKLNSLTKEKTNDGEANIILNFDYKKENESKISSEAGDLYEMLCYGSIQKGFTLKQLLFIADENNYNLDCKSFKEKYENISKRDLMEILADFPKDLLFSEHVKKIEDFLKEKKDCSEKNYLAESIIVIKDEIDEKNFIENSVIVEESYRYDNHLYMEKFIRTKK